MAKFLIRIIFLFTFFAILENPAKTFAEAFDPFSSEKTDTQPAMINALDEKGPIIPQVQFANNEIAMAFQIISDATGWSIFPTTEASKQKINLWAKNITACDLLAKVVTTAGLIYHREGNVIIVSTYDEYLQFYGLAKKIITPKYAEAETLASVIKPFLTKLGKCIVHAQTNSIVLFEVDANLKLIEGVVRNLDCPSDDIGIEIITIKYADAENIAKALQDLFTTKADKRNLDSSQKESLRQLPPPPSPSEKVSESKSKVKASAKIDDIESKNSFPKDVSVFAIGQTNQLIIKARKPEMAMIKNVVKKLDTYVESTTRSYHFLYVDASEIYQGLEEILNLNTNSQTQQNKKGGISEGLTLLEKTNTIVLTSPPSAHRIMTSIANVVDVPAPYEASVIKVYKLENADVNEVAAIIKELISEKDEQEEKANTAKYTSSNLDKTDFKPNIGPNSSTGAKNISPDINLEKSEEIFNKIQAKVSVSDSTNSIIIQASAREQREMKKIIEELDKQRQQVLIKAMIVEVTTIDNLELGMELGNAKGPHIEFSSFGLSTIDPTTGERTVVVSPGGTAAYLDTDDVQAIIHA
ncbi:MAG TPA: secretin N-terminal domain-containing protein, partial [Bacteroidales bacterium]|nr:secretin N-terminal domain-containing protein [Bacteroidales bacterium]